jgi:uncharacterized metal-binding protein YceD (DUF177 family)
VAVEDIPDAGRHIEIEAPATALAGLAELAAVRELPRLSAVFDLNRQGAGVHVAGQVKAKVGQDCVVTLEPLESDVDEVVDLTFAPLPDGAKPAAQIEVKPGEQPTEPLVERTIDLGAIATEFLILGINPYPRKPGAQFAAATDDDGAAKPFAALEALKKRLGGGQS